MLPCYLTTTLSYDTTGQVIQVVDPKNNSTSLSYADRFYTDTGTNPPATYTPATATNAYLTQVTNALGQVSLIGYYFNSGKLAYARDANNNDSYRHYLDNLDRLTHSYGPLTGGNRAWSLTQYTSATLRDLYATVNDPVASPSCTSCQHTQVVLDQWGRLVTSALVNDPDGQTSTDTVFDSSGRVQSVSHPHRAAPAPTDGLEIFSYDGIGRVTQITHPDDDHADTFFGPAITANGGIGSQLCSSANIWIGLSRSGKR